MLYSFLYLQWLTKSYHIINSRWISAKWIGCVFPALEELTERSSGSIHREPTTWGTLQCVITYSSISDPELTKRSRLQVPIKWPRVLNTLIQVNFFKCYNNKVAIDSGISASSHGETRTRSTLLPQKIARLDNIYKKITVQTPNSRQCMTAISGSRETNKWALHRKHSLPREFPAHCMGKKIPNRVQ